MIPSSPLARPVASPPIPSNGSEVGNFLGNAIRIITAMTLRAWPTDGGQLATTQPIGVMTRRPMPGKKKPT